MKRGLHILEADADDSHWNNVMCYCGLTCDSLTFFTLHWNDSFLSVVKIWAESEIFCSCFLLSRVAPFLQHCTTFPWTQVYIADIFEQQGVKSKAPLFLIGGSSDTNFLLKRKSETKSYFYIFNVILFDALMAGVCTSFKRLHLML